MFKGHRFVGMKEKISQAEELTDREKNIYECIFNLASSCENLGHSIQGLIESLQNLNERVKKLESILFRETTCRNIKTRIKL